MIALLALALLDVVDDPVRLTSHLNDAGRVPGGEVRFVLRLEWDGDPTEVSLEELPEPHTENLRIIGVTRASRQVVTPRGASSIVEIGYLLSPLRPGPARIDAIPVTYGFHGARQVRSASPVRLEIAARDAGPSWGWLAVLAASAAVVMALGATAARRFVREAAVAAPAARALPDVEGRTLEELVALARERGIALPPELWEIVQAHKFARQPAPPEALRHLRALVRGERGA